MKKSTLFFFLFSTIIFQLQCQDFAPIGATWHYTQGQFWYGDKTFLKIECIGSTILKGEKCQVLQNNGDGLSCFYHNKYDYVFSRDSVVYIYLPALDNFQTLFDFKKKAGESWKYIYGYSKSSLDTVAIRVDSVKMILINGVSLKQQFLTYTFLTNKIGGNTVSRIVTERIGSHGYFLAEYNFASGGICELGNYPQGLRCYDDAVLGFYSTGLSKDSCNYTYKAPGIGLKEIKTEINYSVFPNPTSDKINIQSGVATRFHFRLYNAFGLLLKSNSLSTGESIHLSQLENGIYYLHLSDAEHTIIKKIIKI